MSPSISVLVRTFNSGETLDRVLERLSLRKDDELLIVDSGSTDETQSIASKRGARWIESPLPFQYGRSLNAGFSVALNPWVLCLSSHCIPLQESFLEDWRAALASLPPNVGAAFGPRYVGEREKQSSGQIQITGPGTLNHGIFVHAGSSNGAYRLEAWRSLSFSETVRTGEDLEWANRALRRGLRIAFVPQAAVLYRNRGSLRYMFLKGWHESQCGEIMPLSLPRAFHSLAINLGALSWRFCRGVIPADMWLRQTAHGFGAFAGGVRARHQQLKNG